MLSEGGSFQIGADDCQKSLGSVAIKGIGISTAVYQVGPHMILDDFRHEPSHGSPCAGKQMHHCLTTGVPFESTFDGIDLTADAADPCQKLLLFLNRMRHG